jgi:hypothetical protein
VTDAYFSFHARFGAPPASGEVETQ